MVKFCINENFIDFIWGCFVLENKFVDKCDVSPNNLTSVAAKVNHLTFGCRLQLIVFSSVPKIAKLLSALLASELINIILNDYLFLHCDFSLLNADCEL